MGNLLLDASSPPIVYNQNAAGTPVTTASFTPPANSLVVVAWAGNSTPGAAAAQPTISDSLATDLTYTLRHHSQYGDGPTADGQCAMWSAPVTTSAAMTISVVHGDTSTGHAIKVWVWTDDGGGTPTWGASKESGQATSHTTVSDSVTATANGSRGVITYVDWNSVGAPGAGTGTTLTGGGAQQQTTVLSYAFALRSTADGASGSPTTLNLTLAGATTTSRWIVAEIVPAGGGATWDYQRTMTIDQTKVDADLTNFPVLVRLHSGNFDFTKAKSDGSDVRFLAADGTTPLTFECERHAFSAAFSGVTEDFEDTTMAIAFTGGWARSSTRGQTGTWSFKSPVTADNATSDTTCTVPVGATSVSFYHYVSTELDFDYFRFLINGAQQFERSGANTTWVQATYPVTAGQTLTFRFIKDTGATAGEDACFIDNVVFSGTASAVEAAEYWVSVPAVSGTVNTTFLMQYGNAGASSVADTTGAVWDADYLGVYHLAQEPSVLSHVGTGAAVHGTATVTPTYPAAYTATPGDLALIFVVSGNSAAGTPATPTNWTSVGTVSGGDGTFGVGAGPRRMTVFSRVVVASMTLPAVGVAGTTPSNSAACMILRKSGGGSYEVTASTGTDITAAVGFSATGATVLPFRAADMAIGAIGTNDALTNGAGFSAQTLTATGVTFGTVAERLDASTTSGNDQSIGLATWDVTQGLGTAAPVLAATLSAASSGPGVIVRVRTLGDITDASGSARHGDTQGLATSAEEETNRTGLGYHLDGTNDHIMLPSFGSLAAATVEAFVNRDASKANAAIVSRGATAAAGTVLFKDNAGTLTAGANGQTAATEAAGIANATWYHVAYTFTQSGNLVLWRDAVARATQAAGATAWDGTSLEIGHEGTAYTSGTTFFDGLVDEVRISDVVRSNAWLVASSASGAGTLLTVGTEGPPGGGSTDATATPAVVAGTAAIGTAAPSTGSLIPATVVTAVASIGTAAPRTGATASPAVVATAATIGAATASAINIPAPATVTGSTVIGGAAIVRATPGTVVATTVIGPARRVYLAPGVTTTLTGLEPGRQYSVVVRAIDTAGQRSADSAPYTFTLPATFTGPTPATVTGAASIGTALPAGGAVAPPGTVQGAATLGAPTVTTTARATPPTVAATSVVGATVSTTAQAAPQTVAGAAAIGAAAPRTGSTASPAGLAATAVLGSPVVSAAATITAGTTVSVIGVPVPAVSTGAAAVPAAILGTAAIGAAPVTVAATAPPATVAATAIIGTAAPAGGAVAPAAPLTATAAVGAPTLTTTGLATPAGITRAAVVGAPFVATGNAPQPPTVAATASIGAPAVTATTSALAAPTALLGAAAVGAPAVTTTASTTAAPAVVAGTATVGSPAVSTGTRAAPAGITTAATVGGPAAAASALASPATLTGAATLGAPTLATTSSATAAPAGITRAAVIGSPVVATGNVPQPGTVSGAATVGAPVVAASSRAVPVVLALAATVGGTATASSVAAPGVLAATASIGAPAIRASSILTPATVPAVATIGAASAGAAVAAQPGTVAGSAAIGAPVVTASARPAPTGVAGLAVIGAPAPTTTALARPATLTGAVVVGGTAHVSAAVAPAGQVLAVTIGVPAVRSDAAVIAGALLGAVAFGAVRIPSNIVAPGDPSVTGGTVTSTVEGAVLRIPPTVTASAAGVAVVTGEPGTGSVVT